MAEATRREADGIVVIGGYGVVGQTACEILGERFPGRVFAAGRDLEKAEAFSRETGGRVLPLRLDLADPREVARALDGAKVVVACAGRDDVGLAGESLERGVHYVDVSASYAFLAEIEGLDEPAKERGATAVLSVGLAPGLTNLLAKRCVEVLGAVRTLDIYVLIGLGEAHGEAAVRWTLENLHGRFESPGVPGTVGGFGDPKATLFPGGYGTRAAYRFDFSDQHVLARTLGVERVATRLCFDPAAATRLLALIGRTGALRALKHRRVRDALVALLLRLPPRLHLGSDGFAVKVEAEGEDGRSFSCSAFGQGEARATGIAAALVAENLYASPVLEPGVFHVERLFDAARFFGRLEGYGIPVDRGPSPG